MKRIAIIVALGISLLAGCAMQQQPQGQRPFTSGNVKMTLQKGVTTQAEVYNAFGAPNIVTQDADGNQLWIYQKDNVTVQRSSTTGGITVLIAEAAIGGLGGIGGSRSRYEQSSRTMTLKITFNKQDIVTDFSSMTTSF